MVGNGLTILENIEAVSGEEDMDFMPGMCWARKGKSVPAGIGRTLRYGFSHSHRR